MTKSGFGTLEGYLSAIGGPLPRIFHRIPLFKTFFLVNIASRTHDHALRLSQLHYYCRRKAWKAIDGCAALKPENEYFEAWKILKGEFRIRNHIEQEVFKGLLEKVKCG